MKTFQIENKHLERDENGRSLLVLDSVDEWAVDSLPGLLILEKNGVKKFVCVERDSGYVYRLLKTKIKATDGADGLYKYICANCRIQDLFFCHVKKILDYAFDTMRAAKV